MLNVSTLHPKFRFWRQNPGGSLLKLNIFGSICIGYSRICSDIWHSHITKLLYPISRAIRQVKFETILKYHGGIYAKYHVQIMLLFVYATTSKRFVIFTCRYFKLSWNTTALSQSNCRNFSCSSIRTWY